jgi:putative ABC transport system ATP-binding protein
MEPSISIRQLNHYFGIGPLRRQILFDIDADIFPGEIVISTGPSGSGKTTMLTLACGLRTVQEGSVVTLGQQLHGAAAEVLVRIRQSIGFIFQAHNLIGALNATQNVEMGLQLDPTITPAESKRRATEMLTAVGLGERLGHYPHQLSGGQKQRVAIARALVRRPKVVLADEPTAALDKASGREVVTLLHALAKKEGASILLVTHDNRILDIADRIITLEDGRVTSFVSGIGASSEQLLHAFAQLQRKGELRRHLEGLDDAGFTTALQTITTEFTRLLTALDVANAEATTALLDQLLLAAASRISGLLGADRTSLFLVDRGRGVLHSRVAQHDGVEPLQIEVPIGVGIAGKVASSAAAMIVADPRQHPDFNPEVDRRTGYTTRSILAVPIPSRSGTVIGVAQALNKVDGTGFDSADQRTLETYAQSLGVILESWSQMFSARRAPAATEPSA